MLLAIFAVSLLESLAVIGILIPGVGLLLAISALASQTNISIFLMLVSGTLGAILGDSLSYAIGQLFKERIHNVWPFKNHPQWIHQGHVFFKKHGNISIFAGRFIGPIRPFIPLVAGIMNMPKRDFLIWNITSAIFGLPYI